MLREVLYFEDVCYRLEALMVYNNIQEDEVMKALKEVSYIIAYDQKLTNINTKYYDFATKLLKKSEELGFSGHLLKKYSVYLFLKDTNILSLACENGVDVSNTTLHAMALKDMGVLQYFMDFDLKNLCENIGYGEKIFEYTPTAPKENPEIEYLCSLQKGDDLLKQFILKYSQMGSGIYAEQGTFKVDSNGDVVCIKNATPLTLNSIPGYGKVKDEIKSNTEAFLNKKSCDSIVLTGRDNIGKYNCIGALIDRYFDRGLRLIELNKSDLKHMDKILDQISSHGKKFILAVDNLTNADIKDNYEYLKVFFGKSVETRPKNVLLYAVIPFEESEFAGNYFSNVINFPELTEKEFLESVSEIAKKAKLAVPEDFLKEQAKNWISGKAEKSAKTAKEFVDTVIWELKQK